MTPTFLKVTPKLQHLCSLDFISYVDGVGDGDDDDVGDDVGDGDGDDFGDDDDDYDGEALASVTGSDVRHRWPQTCRASCH